MNKKILISGSIVAIIMLILMPSIPAIQQKSVEDSSHNDLEEKSHFNDSKDIMTIVRNGHLKHPLLYLSVILATIRAIRGFVLCSFSSDWDYYYGLDITHTIIFLRGAWLWVTAFFWQEFWVTIADALGWGW